MMLSYHNDVNVKAKYVRRFAEHRAADEVIQGTGYDNGRGCFVGCTLDNYDHGRFPVELGWPEWLAVLADSIFEGLAEGEAAQFGTDLLDSVPVGVDLEPVRDLLALRRIDRLIDLQNKNVDYPEQAVVVAALHTARKCHEAEIQGQVCDWSAAKSAAESAAKSAKSAKSAARSAWSAAKSAAWRAAESALSAAESALSAAESAESTAWSTAKSAALSAAWSAAESTALSAAESTAWTAAESAAWSAERDDLFAVLQGLK